MEKCEKQRTRLNVNKSYSSLRKCMRDAVKWTQYRCYSIKRSVQCKHTAIHVSCSWFRCRRRLWKKPTQSVYRRTIHTHIHSYKAFASDIIRMEMKQCVYVATLYRYRYTYSFDIMLLLISKIFGEQFYIGHGT